MSYRKMSQYDHAVLQNSSEQIATLRRVAESIVKQLADIFNGEYVGGVSGLSFEWTGADDLVANVSTPVGPARFRLDYQSDSETINAQMILERRVREPDDSFIWQPVFGLLLKGDGKWQPLDGPVVSMFKVRDALFEVGCSVLFATINGPE